MNVWKLRKNFVTNFTLENYVSKLRNKTIQISSQNQVSITQVVLLDLRQAMKYENNIVIKKT